MFTIVVNLYFEFSMHTCLLILLNLQREVNEHGLPNDLDVIVNLCGYNILQPFKRLGIYNFYLLGH